MIAEKITRTKSTIVVGVAFVLTLLAFVLSDNAGINTVSTITALMSVGFMLYYFFYAGVVVKEYLSHKRTH